MISRSPGARTFLSAQSGINQLADKNVRASVRCAVLLSMAGSAFTASSAQFSPQQIEFFENKIRPVLVQNCYKCHSRSAEKIKGGLTLDTREGLFKGQFHSGQAGRKRAQAESARGQAHTDSPRHV